jgi:hypothetical protein
MLAKKHHIISIYEWKFESLLAITNNMARSLATIVESMKENLQTD